MTVDRRKALSADRCSLSVKPIWVFEKVSTRSRTTSNDICQLSTLLLVAFAQSGEFVQGAVVLLLQQQVIPAD